MQKLPLTPGRQPSRVRYRDRSGASCAVLQTWPPFDVVSNIPAAVDRKFLPGNITGVIRGHEQHRVGDILWGRDTL